MDEKTQLSLREILKYLHQDKERHWDESDKPARGHIFCDITRVAKWLDALATKHH